MIFRGIGILPIFSKNKEYHMVHGTPLGQYIRRYIKMFANLLFLVTHLFDYTYKMIVFTKLADNETFNRSAAVRLPVTLGTNLSTIEILYFLLTTC